MSEGEVVEQLVDFMSILLSGAGVFFTIVSVYLAGLNYVLHNEKFVARMAAFIFVSLSLGMMVTVLIGAQSIHAGLIDRLRDLRDSNELTAAGVAALRNHELGWSYMGGVVTIDEAVLYSIYASMAVTYIALIYLTFLYRWQPHELPRNALLGT